MHGEGGGTPRARAAPVPGRTVPPAHSPAQSRSRACSRDRGQGDETASSPPTPTDRPPPPPPPSQQQQQQQQASGAAVAGADAAGSHRPAAGASGHLPSGALLARRCRRSQPVAPGGRGWGAGAAAHPSPLAPHRGDGGPQRPRPACCRLYVCVLCVLCVVCCVCVHVVCASLCVCARLCVCDVNYRQDVRFQKSRCRAACGNGKITHFHVLHN